MIRALLFLISSLSAVALLVVSVRVVTGNKATAPEEASEAVEVVAPKTVLEVPGRFYRWRDASGHIHYSSAPPPAAVVAEAISFVRRVPVPESVAGSTPGTTATDRNFELSGPFSVYTPDGFSDLMDEVERTSKQLEARDRQLETMRGLLK